MSEILCNVKSRLRRMPANKIVLALASWRKNRWIAWHDFQDQAAQRAEQPEVGVGLSTQPW